MRLLIIVTCLLFTSSAFAQETYFDKSRIPISDGRIAYSLVDTAKKIPKADLFALVNQWTAKRVGQTTSSIQLNDKDNGKLITKISIPSSHFVTSGKQNIPVNFTINMILNFTVEDSKYKLLINNLSVATSARLVGNKLFERTESSYDSLLSNYPNPEEYKMKPKSEQSMYQYQSKYLNAMHTEVLKILTSVKEFMRKGNTAGES